MLTVKISEHPMQKAHKPYLSREAAHEEGIGRAAAAMETRLIESANLSSPNDPQLSSLMVEEGLVTDSQLQEALSTARHGKLSNCA
jgi:hypothetical protein